MMARISRSMVLAGVLVWVAGCGDRPVAAPVAGGAQASHPHSHGEGPNGGAVADWGGGQYHVEFTVNHDTQEATVYVLDSNATSPAPVRAEKLLLSIAEPAFQVELVPQPLEGEGEGTCSRFAGRHESLGIVREFSGTISGEVDGTPFAGDFQEVGH